MNFHVIYVCTHIYTCIGEMRERPKWKYLSLQSPIELSRLDAVAMVLQAIITYKAKEPRDYEEYMRLWSSFKQANCVYYVNYVPLSLLCRRTDSSIYNSLSSLNMVFPVKVFRSSLWRVVVLQSPRFEVQVQVHFYWHGLFLALAVSYFGIRALKIKDQTQPSLSCVHVFSIVFFSVY